MPHRKAMCPTSRSYGQTGVGRDPVKGGEQSALVSSTLGPCIHSLLERRDLWRREAEARQHSQPDPAMPPGHTLMPESQRLETLNNLLQSEYLGQGWLTGCPRGTMHPYPTLNCFLSTVPSCRPEPAAT